ncbi:MAG: class I SAM-dependent methyltransferase [Crocinitomicaceae bacterium]|nr:class I SAM-dependent methyltransferase [Crocinitomicaceae bacterium]
MKSLEELQGLDIYLLDQFLKGRINKKSRILDAGCGMGRNIHFLIREGYNVTAFDPNPEVIDDLKSIYPQKKDNFKVSSIEELTLEAKFDFVICNAVLHFAESHEHFNNMFKSLTNLLALGGILFIRMTSDIGLSGFKQDLSDGRYYLPDDSVRYLLSRNKVDELLSVHELDLLEPVKSLNVDELRCMTTLVFVKQ